MTSWQDVRVFISSTFRDMGAERDHLVKRVFPQLRERLLPYRIHLIDIDLRWGITPEEAENDRVLDLCLQQIDECRPFFAGILGQRYGWVPDSIMLPQEPKYGRIQGMTGKSVTELEILYGVLDNPAMKEHAFFFLRDEATLNTVPSDRLDIYRDTGDLADKLDHLKREIQDSRYPVTPYSAHWDSHQQRMAGLDAFGDAVFEQLWQGIKAEHKLPDAPPKFDENPLQEERDYHVRFIELRTRVYIGRESVQEDLTRYADGGSAVPCLVTGPSGSGKSAALAKFVSNYREKHRDVLVLPHFIGASPRSTGLRDMLRRLYEELRDTFHFTDTKEREGQPPETVPAEIPFDLNPLVNRFKEFIEKSGENRDCPERSEERAETELPQDSLDGRDRVVPSSKTGTGGLLNKPAQAARD